MTINIADNSPRVSYSVAQGVTQTSFAIPFEFFDDTDLNVYVDGTLKVLNSDYTLSGGSGATGTATMSVTGASGGSTVVFTRSVPLERTTDFPTSGPFQIGALNTELDRFMAIAADLLDKSDRALQVTDYDADVSLILPDVDNRKGKTLAFNESTGAVEAGPSISDTQSVASASADIALLADIQDGTVATNTLTILAPISSNITTVASISANVTTVAGVSTKVTTVADNIADVTSVADNIAELLLVDTNAAAAAASATAAAGSASSALTSASSASTSATAAALSETNAASSASTASTAATTATTQSTAAASSATAAAASASAASTSATNAASSAASSSASASAAAASLDSFDDRYLGSKALAPTVDNDGQALLVGALYWNSVNKVMYVWDGNAWQNINSFQIGGTISLDNGSETAPALNFTSDGDTGIYRSGDNSFSFATNGQEAATFEYAGATAFQLLSSTGDELLNVDETTDDLLQVINTDDEVLFSVSNTSGVAINKNTTVTGTTTTTNFVSLSNTALNADGTTVLTVDRATSNGSLVDFNREGTAVGSVGAYGNGMYLGSPLGLQAYLWMGDGAVRPATSTGQYRTSAINLGHTSSRFKNLYLDGGVYLGGTDAANRLDDYEEGVWTPVLTSSGTAPTATYGNINGGRYTKIGNKVFITGTLHTSSNSGGTGTLYITGLPFTRANDPYNGYLDAGAVASDQLTTSGRTWASAVVIPNTARVEIGVYGFSLSGAAAQVTDIPNANNYIHFSISLTV